MQKTNNTVGNKDNIAPTKGIPIKLIIPVTTDIIKVIIKIVPACA